MKRKRGVHRVSGVACPDGIVSPADLANSVIGTEVKDVGGKMRGKVIAAAATNKSIAVTVEWKTGERQNILLLSK